MPLSTYKVVTVGNVGLSEAQTRRLAQLVAALPGGNASCVVRAVCRWALESGVEAEALRPHLPRAHESRVDFWRDLVTKAPLPLTRARPGRLPLSRGASSVSLGRPKRECKEAIFHPSKKRRGPPASDPLHR